MTLPELLVFGLATWRISVLFVREEGPYGVFKAIREWAGIQHDDGGEVSIIPGNFTAQLLSCIWCCSIWVASFLAILYALFPVPSLYFAMTFAFSAIAIVIDVYVGRK